MTAADTQVTGLRSTDYLRRGGQLLWADIEQAVDWKVEAFKINHYLPKIIVGISRGGMLPAIMLAHQLGIKDVRLFQIESYNGKGVAGGVIVNSDPEELVSCNRQDTLVIDDLWDTGATMDLIKRVAPNSLTGTLFHKSDRSSRLPPINFPGLWLPKDQWVTFPWEKQHG